MGERIRADGMDGLARGRNLPGSSRASQRAGFEVVRLRPFRKRSAPINRFLPRSPEVIGQCADEKGCRDDCEQAFLFHVARMYTIKAGLGNPAFTDTFGNPLKTNLKFSAAALLTAFTRH